jgi:hypothetical protein
VACGTFGSSERSARRFRSQASYLDSGDEEFVGSVQRGREACGVELSEHALGVVEAPNQ